MNSDVLDSLSKVLLVLLIGVLLVVLYNRLLKALGKGKYQTSYPKLFDPERLEQEQLLIIHFSLPKSTHVKLEVLDMDDQLISTLMDDEANAKMYTFKLDYSSMIEGKYACKLITDNQSVYKYFSV